MKKCMKKLHNVTLLALATIINSLSLSVATAQGAGAPPKTISIKNKTLRVTGVSDLSIRYDGSESKISSVATKVQATVLNSSDAAIKAAISGGATVFFYDMDYPAGSQARRVFDVCMRAVEGARPTDSVRLTGDFEILSKGNKIFVRKVRACQSSSTASVVGEVKAPVVGEVKAPVGEDVKIPIGETVKAPVGQPAPSYKPGDLNKDGTVDILDAAEFINLCGGNANAANRPTECDINGDGQYTSADADLLAASIQ
jgi:hypothetical protein